MYVSRNHEQKLVMSPSIKLQKLHRDPGSCALAEAGHLTNYARAPDRRPNPTDNPLGLDARVMAHQTYCISNDDIAAERSRSNTMVIFDEAMNIEGFQSCVSPSKTSTTRRPGLDPLLEARYDANGSGDKHDTTPSSSGVFNHHVVDKENHGRSYALSQLSDAPQDHRVGVQLELKHLARLGYLQGNKEHLISCSGPAQSPVEGSCDEANVLEDLDPSIRGSSRPIPVWLDGVLLPSIEPELEHHVSQSSFGCCHTTCALTPGPRDCAVKSTAQAATKSRRPKSAATETAAIKASGAKSRAALLYFCNLGLHPAHIPLIFAGTADITPQRMTSSIAEWASSWDWRIFGTRWLYHLVERAVQRYERTAGGGLRYKRIRGRNLKLFWTHPLRCRRLDVLRLMKPLGDVVDLRRAWEDEDCRDWLETVFWVACAATYAFRVVRGQNKEDMSAVYRTIKKAVQLHGGDVPRAEKIPTVKGVNALRSVVELNPSLLLLEGNECVRSRSQDRGEEESQDSGDECEFQDDEEQLDVGEIGDGMATLDVCLKG